MPKRLREVLLSGFAARLGPQGEALLFTAARIDHLDKTILPALAPANSSSATASPTRRAPIRAPLGDVSGDLIAALERSRSATTGPT